MDQTKPSGSRKPRRLNGQSQPSRRLLVGALGVFAGAAFCESHGPFRATASSNGLAVRTRAGIAFQTPVSLTVAGPDGRRLDLAIDAAFRGIRAVEAASSIYRPDSALVRLNREGRIANPPHELVLLVRHALNLARTTGGRFDPTVQPLWDLWAAHHRRHVRPDAGALRDALRRVDWRGVTVTDEAIHFDRPGMAMTLNSINQGYAADVVMAILAAQGVTNAFVDTGEFGARGRYPSGRGWRLGVAAPRAPERLAYTVDPFRRFSATSGDYKTAFSPDSRDHHIFDPRTGCSPPDWSSITVSAPSGLVADGLSTALFTLDEDEARRLLALHPDCGARFFDKAGNERSEVA